MNLGQMMMVAGAMVLLGILILNANSTVYDVNDTMYTSEFGITAISLATSLVEEASGKMYDKITADSTAPAVYDSSLFTAPNALGPETGESYRGTKDYNDFDDFNGLYLVYKSTNAADSALVFPGAKVMKVEGIRAVYLVRCKVEYVSPPNLDVPYTIKPTWQKKMTVTVTSPSMTSVDPSKKDTLYYPAILSYWN
jgi:hypothetical protein